MSTRLRLEATLTLPVQSPWPERRYPIGDVAAVNVFGVRVPVPVLDSGRMRTRYRQTAALPLLSETLGSPGSIAGLVRGVMVRMRNLLARPMTGYKRNRRHWWSRALYSRKMSNELHGDSGRSRREIINLSAGLKAFKECGVFRRTRSQEEFLKMPLHLQMLSR